VRGRKPTPSTLRLLHGNPGHRPINPDEPKPPAHDLTPPGDLAGEALAEWGRMAPRLQKSGLLSELDEKALALYCCSYADWVAASKKVEEFGTVIKGPKGFPMPSPYVRLVEKAWERMRKMLIEFGMTPSARARVTTTEPQGAQDPFAKFDSQSLERWEPKA
jgi:P27 family predicted phage terminase small subunit